MAGLPVGVLAIEPSGHAPWVSRGGDAAFMAFQAVAAIALAALWGWDRRRRFYAEHPWKRVERQARRKAARELRRLRRAEAEGDSAEFVLAAAAALREASAPRTGGMAASLVGEDVLRVLSEGERRCEPGELVRSVFEAADAVRFRDECADDLRRMELRMAIESLVTTLLSRPLRR